MFRKEKVPFSETGVLNRLVNDYLEKKDSLRNFYGEYPNREGFAEVLKTLPYAGLDRETLFNAILKQSQLVSNTTALSLENISKLKSKKTFTVTTGHQLCLFTGPLYFIHKINSTIRLASYLKQEFPEYEFVPVYWMASEDHDFEEVNHFYLFGKKLSWESTQKGAVGFFKTSELQPVFEQLKEIAGTAPQAEALLKLFENAYLSHHTLADATHYLVNALFGQHGLVIVDGNNKQLKEIFKPYFKQDIFDQSAFSVVNKSIATLKELGYEAQVNPREINCFLLDDNKRARIEKTETGFGFVGENTALAKTEMLALVENKVESISPNVTLRPLYQQVILPNLAYIGGPGELAYWLEYKAFFDASKVFYPILVPRNFVMLFDSGTLGRIEKLGFKPADLFRSEKELVDDVVEKTSGSFDLEAEKKELQLLFETITQKVSHVDKSLAGATQAEFQKAANGLDALSGKVNKSLKQKSETGINQVKNIRQKLFPENIPQERFENFSAYFLKEGPAFMDALFEQSEALADAQLLLLQK